jgi:DICT domain-containing protein
MFEHALKLASAARAENLGTINILSRRDFDERKTISFRAPVPCLEYASLLIESNVLLQTNRRGRIYVCFEKLSRMEAIANRYLRMADVSERIFIFGEPDWKPPRHPHVKLLKTSRDMKLSREWFLIAESSTMQVALVARDEEGFGVPDLESRKFFAVKTSEPAIVSELAAVAENLASVLAAH